MNIEARGLKKYFPIKRGIFQRTSGWIKAVDGVSFAISKGETLGLVGESGCGKTTVGRLALGLLEPDGGEFIIDGTDIFRARRADLIRNIRKKAQIVFQDPSDSLNPRMQVRHIIAEGPRIFRTWSRDEEFTEIKRLLGLVGISGDVHGRYPHQFSGGQRQRIGIARALALNPEFLVLDEPVSSLDVSIQAQILNLLLDLQSRFGISYLFISHDLRIVKYMSDRVAVMYLGRIVESASNKELYTNPRHPYTEALLSAIPRLRGGRGERVLLKRDIAARSDIPSGCCFRLRCPYAKHICESEPPFEEKAQGHFSACFFR